jgi:hypothetical protein
MLEIVLCIYCACITWLYWQYGEYGILPFAGLYTAGFSTVGALTMRQAMTRTV